MGKELTIVDVARHARVSPTTVSNFLNGRDAEMRPETKARVRRSIDELGYRPNLVARRLRTGRASMIGLIVPSVANPFWGSWARVLEAHALDHGYQVFLCNSERNPGRERRYAEELWANGVDTVVLSTSLPSLEHLSEVMVSGLRVIAFDRESQPDDPPTLSSVSVDNVLGARLATRHLIELGHKRIGFISGAIATVSRRRRLAGYREELESAHLSYDPELVWTDSGYGDAESALVGNRGMGALLRLPQPPTAVVTINDMYALGACAAIRDAGLDVPGVSVVGFDDVVLAKLWSPPLTTIHQPLDKMAKFILDAVCNRAQDDEQRDKSSVMQPHLVIRDSTSPPPLARTLASSRSQDGAGRGTDV
jgi:DNA-binding LacI/PurR family transcriptional regulator